MLHVYTDGSGKPKSIYGYYVEETNQSRVYKGEDLTNNKAEYLAIEVALKDLLEKDRDIVIYSDSDIVVNQLKHEYAINNDRLRECAIRIWNMISSHKANVRFEKIDRKNNKAGKILGS